MSCQLLEAPVRVRAQGDRAHAAPGATRCGGCTVQGLRLVDVDGGGAELHPCEGHDVLQRIALFNAGDIPARFARASFESFSTQPRGQLVQDLADAFAATHQWANDYLPGNAGESQGVVLGGTVGVGKTHLVVAALRVLTLEKGVPCRFVDYVDLVQRIKAGWDQGHGSSALLDELCAVEVLAIDDLGRGVASEWNQSLVDMLVSRRYNAGRVTLATTNHRFRAVAAEAGAFRQEVLADRIGERAASRLLGGATVLRIEASDHRHRGAPGI